MGGVGFGIRPISDSLVGLDDMHVGLSAPFSFGTAFTLGMIPMDVGLTFSCRWWMSHQSDEFHGARCGGARINSNKK